MKRGNNTDDPAEKGRGANHMQKGNPGDVPRLAHCGEEALPGRGKLSL